jgi:hypothetical protein
VTVLGGGVHHECAHRLSGRIGGCATVGDRHRRRQELKELREQNARLKRLLAEAELQKDALREVAGGSRTNPRPGASSQ